MNRDTTYFTFGKVTGHAIRINTRQKFDRWVPETVQARLARHFGVESLAGVALAVSTRKSKGAFHLPAKVHDGWTNSDWTVLDICGSGVMEFMGRKGVFPKGGVYFSVV